MYTLFKLVRLLSVEKDVNPVKITQYAWRQHGESSLLALNCSNGFILLQFCCSGQRSLVKQLPWPRDHPIVWMCFDPTVAWLMVLTDNGNVFILPALSMLDPSSQVNQLWKLDDVTVITGLAMRGTPTCAVWWHTLDDQQIAIVATKVGEIIFLNLLKRDMVSKTGVDEHIRGMELVGDDQQISTHLLITGKSGQQWKMLLEKRVAKVSPPDEELSDMGYDNIDGLKLPVLSILSVPDGGVRVPTDCCNHFHAGSPFMVVYCDQCRPRSDDDVEDDMFFPMRLYHFPRSVTLSPQYAKGRHFIVAHCDKNSTYQVFDSNIEHNPLFVYKLPLGSLGVILTDRIMFTASRLGGDKKLLVLSNQRAETAVTDEKDFNKEAIMQQFEIPPNEKLLTILPKSFPFYWHEKLEDQQVKLSQDHDDAQTGTLVAEQSKAPSALGIPLSSHSVLDGCIIVTDTTVYECRPRISPERLFLELCMSQSDALFAEQLGISLGLDLNFLFEVAADYLLSLGNSKQATRLFHLSKGSAVKRVSSFARYGFIQEIMPFLQQLLSKGAPEVGEGDRRQLAGLALHGLVHKLRQDIYNEELTNALRQFLLNSFDYEDRTALNLLSEAALEDILIEFAMARGLVIEALEALAQQGRFRLSDASLALLIDKGFSAHIAQVASGAFLQCLSLTNLVAIFCEKPQLIAQHPDLLLSNLDSLELNALLRLAGVLDPSRPLVRGFVHRKLMSRRRTSSLTSLTGSGEYGEGGVIKKDGSHVVDAVTLVQCYLMVVIHLNTRRRHEGEMVNDDFLFINPADMIQSAVSSSQPMRLKLACRPNPIGCGQCHTAVVKNGDLYTWGRALHGRLGHGEMKGNQSVNTPCKVGAFGRLQVRVVSVACGSEHTIALTQQGLYGWGSSRYGQVGVNTKHVYTRPMLIEELARVMCVAVDCGQYHSLALSDDAQVYSWGWGVHGQLGHGDTEERLVPKLISQLGNQSITRIAAGYCHSLVLNDKGELFAFGCSFFGQLGLGNIVKHTVPVKVVTIQEKVVTMATKFFHSAAVTADNRVYQWGSHPHGLRHFVHAQRRARQAGQTTFEQSDGHLKPRIVDTSYVRGKIKLLVCGSFHTCIVTKDGDLYTWGRNLDGQLGNGQRQDMRIPQMVTQINDRQLVHLTSGGEFNAAMDNNGQIWVWGRNEYGQLGVQGSDLRLSNRIKPAGMKAAAQGVTEVSVPTPIQLQPQSPMSPNLTGSLMESFSVDESMENFHSMASWDIEDDADTSTMSLPDLSQFGSKEHDRPVVSVILQCLPSLCDCNQLVRDCVSHEEWSLAVTVNLHLHNYTQALGYHFLLLRENRPRLDIEVFTEASIKVFHHYYSLVTKPEMTSARRETDIRNLLQQVLYHWEVTCISVHSLEQCLGQTLEDTACLLAAMIFRTSPDKQLDEKSDTEKPTLLSPSPAFLSRLSTSFCLKITSLVLQKLGSNIDKTHPWAFSFLKKLGGDNFDSLPSAMLDGDKLSYEQLWLDIMQNLQKTADARKFIHITHSELDRLDEQLSDPDQSQGQTTLAVFFTCGHYYTKDMFVREVDKYCRDFRIGPHKVPETLSVLTDYYQRKGCLPLACPRCVFSAVSNIT